MFGVILNLMYAALLIVLSPVLVYKRMRFGKYRDGWKQKFWGELPARLNTAEKKRIWIHAVSVGEVLQLRPIIASLKQKFAHLDILVTTTTSTGFQVAKEKLSDVDVSYFPLDFTWAAKRALSRVQPDMIVLVELELWPNFLREAFTQDIPVALINGRLSEKSHRGYRLAKSLFAKLLNQFSLIAVQTEEYKQRFISLGVCQECVHVTGSVKFDGLQNNRNRDAVHNLRSFFEIGEDELVFIAGSTQAPEEEMAVKAFQALQQHLPNSRLIIVPRHPERGEAVSQIIKASGFPVRRRSLGESVELQPKSVGLLDTVGELNDCWALADVAFVGGSFGTRGGQNMLEPAAYGVPVCFGPNTHNFKQIVELLKLNRAGECVYDQEQLDTFIISVSQNRMKEMGQRAQQLVLEHQGATSRTVGLLADLLQSDHHRNCLMEAA